MACTGACSSSCSGTCAGSCVSGCANQCTGCSTTCYGCAGACQGTCYASCINGCTSCSGTCSGGCSGCSGCSGTCSGTCSGCSGTCTGNCSGSCSGSCSGCSGTCSSTCNNACSSSSASQAIADIGANIMNRGMVTASDFTNMLNATVNEYTRRRNAGVVNITAPVSGYTTTPNTSVAVFLESAQGIFTNLNSFPNSGKNYTLPSDMVVSTDNLKDAISYIRELMARNIYTNGGL